MRLDICIHTASNKMHWSPPTKPVSPPGRQDAYNLPWICQPLLSAKRSHGGLLRGRGDCSQAPMSALGPPCCPAFGVSPTAPGRRLRSPGPAGPSAHASHCRVWRHKEVYSSQMTKPGSLPPRQHTPCLLTRPCWKHGSSLGDRRCPSSL